MEVHLPPAGEAVLEPLATMHRAELQSLNGVFVIPQLPRP